MVRRSVDADGSAKVPTGRQSASRQAEHLTSLGQKLRSVSGHQWTRNCSVQIDWTDHIVRKSQIVVARRSESDLLLKREQMVRLPPDCGARRQQRHYELQNVLLNT